MFFKKYRLEKHLNNLKIGNLNIKKKAALKLGKLRDQQAVGSLLEVLNTTEDEELAHSTVIALGRISGNQAVETLIDVLLRNGRFCGLGFHDLEYDTFVALVNIGDKRALGPLKSVLERYTNSYEDGKSEYEGYKNQNDACIERDRVGADNDYMYSAPSYLADDLGRARQDAATARMILTHRKRKVEKYEVLMKKIEAKTL